LLPSRISDFSTTPTQKHAGHFGGFAAHQCAARQFATVADAGNDRCGYINIELAGGVIVEEEQWFCARDNQVVNTHGYQINANGVVFTQVHGQTEFGTHAISTGNQYRFAVSLGNFTQSGKTAETCHHLRATGTFGYAFDSFDQGITGININTGIFVTQGSGRGLLFAHRVGFARAEVSKKGRHSTSLSMVRGVLMVRTGRKYRIRSLRSALLPVTMPNFPPGCSLQPRVSLFHQDCSGADFVTTFNVFAA
jgi:hypothetical protein